MTHYVKSGKKTSMISEDDVKVSTSLEPAIYSIGTSPMGEIWLEKASPFVLPKKVYGNTEEMAVRILNTFEDRPTSTGAHFDGVKGSGKTLLSKQTATMAVERGYPVILVNQPLCGENFNRFIQSIDCPAVVLFDEFEKVYHDNDLQNQILTLFDGVYPSKKLFILTTNDSYKVSDYMKNRPGRMFYALSFDALTQEAIQEFLNDNLKNKDHIDEVVRYTSVYTFFNFDMLAALVEEMNRYNEPMKEALRFMNIKPEIHKLDTFSKIISYGEYVSVLSQSCEYDPSEFYECYSPDYLARMMVQAKNPDYSRARSISALNARGEDPVMEEEVALTSKLELFQDEDCDINFRDEDLKEYDHKRARFIYEREMNGEKIQIFISRNPRDKKQALLY